MAKRHDPADASDRRGTVMLRYALGDVARLCANGARIAARSPSGCWACQGGSDGLLKIKGMLVNPQALVDAVAAEAEALEFQVVVAKEDAGDPLSMAACPKIVPAAQAGADLAERLQRSVQRAIGVTPAVERIRPTTR